jgi:DNA-binding protein H-NS
MANLEGMNVQALMSLRDQVDKRLLECRAELEKQLAALAGQASSKGKSGKSLKGRKVPPKYRSPSGETWAGRGQRPRWMVEALKKGKKIDSFLIKKLTSQSWLAPTAKASAEAQRLATAAIRVAQEEEVSGGQSILPVRYKVLDGRACKSLGQCNDHTALNNHSQHLEDTHVLIAEISLLSVCSIGRMLRHQRRVQTYAVRAVELGYSVGLAPVAPLLFSIPRSHI